MNRITVAAESLAAFRESVQAAQWPPEDVDVLRRFDDAMGRLRMAVDGLGVEVSRRYSPNG